MQMCVSRHQARGPLVECHMRPVAILLSDFYFSNLSFTFILLSVCSALTAFHYNTEFHVTGKRVLTAHVTLSGQNMKGNGVGHFGFVFFLSL